MAQGLMTVEEYTKRAATARVVYEHLFQQAVSVLPPMLTEGDNVECYYTMTDLAAVLPGWSKSQVANQITWLRNWGWIEKRGRSTHYLGRRDERGRFLLIADLAAFNATGEQRVVSRLILSIVIEDAPEPTLENTRRGAARQWRGTQTEGGGDSLNDLGA